MSDHYANKKRGRKYVNHVGVVVTRIKASKGWRKHVRERAWRERKRIAALGQKLSSK